MSFRKERKIILNINQFSFFQKRFRKKGLIKLYPARKINSCYFDNKNLDLFHESEEGILPRKKIRFRWYNSEPIYFIESKISSLEGRFKTSKPTSHVEQKNIFKLEIKDQKYGILKPELLVSYERSYFKLGNLRITFDENIKYKNINHHSKISYLDKESVMEIKTNIDITDEYIEGLLSSSNERFSKYSRGVKLTKRL